MSNWVLIDGDRVVELGESPENVEPRLFELLLAGKLSRPNAIVDIGSPHEASIAVGISGERAYIEFGTKDGDPPYYRVVDSSSASGREEVVFMYKGERTPIPARKCVPVDELIPIVKHFIVTESMPEWITTEEV
jgi:hypothetical protein